MIGGQDLSKFLINYNSADWANKVNAQLQAALTQGLPFSEKYTQQAVNAVQGYDQQARNNINQGFQQAQALDAPKHLATYNALDVYQQNLGLPTPVGGSFQLAQGMQNGVLGQPQSVPQQFQTQGYNQGVPQYYNPAPGGLFNNGVQ